MIDDGPRANRILIAQLTGEARRRVRWCELSGDEETAAVAALRELAGRRADLLAVVAGIFEGASEASWTSRWRGRPQHCAAWLALTRSRSRPGSGRAAGARPMPGDRRSRAERELSQKSQPGRPRRSGSSAQDG